MIRGLCAWVGLLIGTIIQVIFSYCSVSKNLCTSLRHRKPHPSHFSAWRAQNERLCVLVRGSRGSGSRFLKSMEQSVRCARSVIRCCSTPLISAARQPREVMIGEMACLYVRPIISHSTLTCLQSIQTRLKLC